MSDQKTVAFHTFGCKVNQYETEELREQLRFGGFSIVPADQSADVYILNSCTVTADASDPSTVNVPALTAVPPP